MDIQIVAFARERDSAHKLKMDLEDAGHEVRIEISQFDGCYAYTAYGQSWCRHEPKCFIPGYRPGEVAP